MDAGHARYGVFLDPRAPSDGLTVLDVSDAANKMAGTPSPAAAPRPPRKPPQKKQ